MMLIGKGERPVELEKDDMLEKIIVLQGNSPIGPILQRVLEKAGHNVVLGTSDSDSLSVPPESSPSLVITDCMHSNCVDSLDTLRHVHEAAPQAKIIALFSGMVNQAERQVVANQPGVVRVLDDPFEVGGLLEVMRKAINVSS